MICLVCIHILFPVFERCRELIVIKSFIYDLLSVPCVVFMSVKSIGPPGLFFLYNFSDIFIQIVFLVKIVQYAYKIQDTTNFI